MIDKFIFILKNTLEYCFYRFVWFGALALMTFLLLCLNNLLFGLVPGDSIIDILFSGSTDGLTVTKTFAEVLGFFFSLVVGFPLTVSIIQNIVGDEPHYSSVLPQLFAKRQRRYFWVLVKVYAIAIVPWLLFWQGSILAGSFLSEEVLGYAWGAGVAVLAVFSIYVLTRLELAEVFVAIDKGNELSASWKFTKGNVLLILFAFTVLIALLTIITVFVILMSVLVYDLIPQILEPVYDALFSAVIGLVFTVPISAASGFTYLVLQKK